MVPLHEALKATGADPASPSRSGTRRSSVLSEQDRLPMTSKTLNKLRKDLKDAIMALEGTVAAAEEDERHIDYLRRMWSRFFDALTYQIPLLPPQDYADPTAASPESFLEPHPEAVKNVGEHWWLRLHIDKDLAFRYAEEFLRSYREVGAYIGQMAQTVRDNAGVKRQGPEYYREEAAREVEHMANFPNSYAERVLRKRFPDSDPFTLPRADAVDAVMNAKYERHMENEKYSATAFSGGYQTRAMEEVDTMIGALRKVFKRYRSEEKGNLQDIWGPEQGAEKHRGVQQSRLGREPKRGEIATKPVPRPAEGGTINGVTVVNKAGLVGLAWDGFKEAVGLAARLLKRKGFGFILGDIPVIARSKKHATTVHYTAPGREGMTSKAAGTYHIERQRGNIEGPSTGENRVQIYVRAQNDLGTTPAWIAKVLVHEWGHHYYYAFLPAKLRRRYEQHFRKADAFTTQYARENPSEDFAETFVWYVAARAFRGVKKYEPYGDVWDRWKDVVSRDPKVKIQAEATLTELFDSPVPYRRESGTAYTFTAEGEYDVEYEVTFWPLGSARPDEYEVEFAARLGGDTEVGIVGFRDPGLTGQVFSTVIEIIRDFVDGYKKPRGLYFTAKEASRSSLYKAMVQRFAKDIGWEFKVRPGARGGSTSFFVHHPDLEEASFLADVRRKLRKKFLAEVMDLEELFRDPAPFEKVDNVSYEFEVTSADEERLRYEVLFLSDSQAPPELRYFTKEVEFGLTSINGRTAGGGGIGIENFSDRSVAMKVFATVLEVIRHYLRNNRVVALTFGASEPSRQSLYKTLCSRFAKELGWVWYAFRVTQEIKEAYFVIAKDDETLETLKSAMTGPKAVAASTTVDISDLLTEQAPPATRTHYRDAQLAESVSARLYSSRQRGGGSCAGKMEKFSQIDARMGGRCA